MTFKIHTTKIHKIILCVKTSSHTFDDLFMISLFVHSLQIVSACNMNNMRADDFELSLVFFFEIFNFFTDHVFVINLFYTIA